jgi:hypothetical protein
MIAMLSRKQMLRRNRFMIAILQRCVGTDYCALGEKKACEACARIGPLSHRVQAIIF